ncbi:Fic family protein [Sorangium sp. So ce117]|uniref:Fic family protein n=1 Tax=Sorangium sp. So ce117 TaxID=3133277 RepID=UPI003F62FD35
MTAKRCRSCDHSRRKYIDGWNGHDCELEPFCKLTDLRLAELACSHHGGAIRVEQHRAIFKSMYDGHMEAERIVNRMSFGDDCDRFLRQAKYLHNIIFRRTGLSFAGQFRQNGDAPVLYGRSGREREGAPADQIEPKLREMHMGVFACVSFDKLDKNRLARLCARYLEEFFRIHPFHDGNGRVARLFLKLIAKRTSAFMFDLIPDRSRASEEYVGALEYAHKRVDQRINNASKVSDPYRPLVDWLLLYLKDAPGEDELREPDSGPEWAEEEPDTPQAG